ncbi:MAG: helix-turn-helix transcriptional regulator [Pseudomonadota bacterium]
MLETLGDRQRQLLHCLLQYKAGMTVEQLVDALAITRTAVNQHLAALERDGFVEKAALRNTGGRPGRAYVLTLKGINLFPKQYAWFSALLLEGLKKELGSEGLARHLRAMGKTLALHVRAQRGAGATRHRIVDLVNVMNHYGYQARAVPAQQRLPTVEAHNCVYHDLARQYPEVCQFDLGLLAEATQCEVEHQECMVRGGAVCRFKFSEWMKKK